MVPSMEEERKISRFCDTDTYTTLGEKRKERRNQNEIFSKRSFTTIITPKVSIPVSMSLKVTKITVVRSREIAKRFYFIKNKKFTFPLQKLWDKDKSPLTVPPVFGCIDDAASRLCCETNEIHSVLFAVKFFVQSKSWLWEIVARYGRGLKDFYWIHLLSTLSTINVNGFVIAGSHERFSIVKIDWCNGLRLN